MSYCCKIFSCLVMTFHWIFTYYSCTHVNKHLCTTSDKIFWGLHQRVCVCFGIYWLDLCQTHFHNSCCSLHTWMLVCFLWLDNELDINLTLKINFILYGNVLPGFFIFWLVQKMLWVSRCFLRDTQTDLQVLSHIIKHHRNLFWRLIS